MKEHLQRTVGFALVPALSLLSSLMVLPLISTKYGGAGWSSLTLGQSVGALISVFVGLSWPMIGGYRVATAENNLDRTSLYALSHYSRLCVLAVLGPIGCLLTFLLSPAFGLEASLFCLGTAFNGLTAAWYFAGLGDPKPLIVNEGVVRLSMYGVVIAGMSFGLELWFYAVIYTLSGVVMATLNWMTVMKGQNDYVRPTRRQVFAVVREQVFGTVSRVFQAAFTFGGPLFMAGFRPQDLSAFSGYDQIQKSGTGAASAVTSSLVGWASGPSKTRFGSRSFIAICICLLGSLGFGILWSIFGPYVIGYVFAGVLSPSKSALVLVGLNICILFLVAAFELLVMVPRGLAQAVYRNNMVASAVGLGAILTGILVNGTDGALAASCVYGLVGLILHGSALVRAKRSSAVGRRRFCASDS